MKKELAFPRPYSEGPHQPSLVDEDAQEGMTLRDYFAAKAMQALMTNDRVSQEFNEMYQEGKDMMAAMAKGAYNIADAMLKERGTN